MMSEEPQLQLLGRPRLLGAQVPLLYLGSWVILLLSLTLAYGCGFFFSCFVFAC